ncbi:hypothetical protein D9758_012723 [Tetrapyrgos nigripes]|uniref:Uncharacterized protein n=1 Tax=Tetrapyrgos nigripes TaxID=182062 RepID=A0A8H5CW10_9AGAR|nr:hypothetical protein D9758_012723 [Tetrapyrgos nigripes]
MNLFIPFSAGVAIYYYAALWPWNISTILSLDGGPNELVDLRDKSDAGSLNATIHAKSTQDFDVRWWRDGLINEEHTLVISMGDGKLAQWAIVDRLAFTSINSSTSTSTLPDNSVAPTSSPASSASTRSGSKTPLIAGLVVGIIGAILLSCS